MTHQYTLKTHIAFWNDAESAQPFDPVRQLVDPPTGSRLMALIAPIYISETSNVYIISAQVPGFKKDELVIDVMGHTLTRNGSTELKEDPDAQKLRYIVMLI